LSSGCAARSARRTQYQPICFLEHSAEQASPTLPACAVCAMRYSLACFSC
jgi:hypothetical protein